MSGPNNGRGDSSGTPTRNTRRAAASDKPTRPGSARAVIEAARAQLTALRTQVAEERRIREAAERVVQHLQGLMADHEVELREARRAAPPAASPRELREARDRIGELERALHEATARAQRAEAERDTAVHAMSEGGEQGRDVRAALAGARPLAAARADVKRLTGEVSELQAALSEARRENALIQQEAEAQLEGAFAAVEAAGEEADALREQLASAEGSSESVRELREQLAKATFERTRLLGENERLVKVRDAAQAGRDAERRRLRRELEQLRKELADRTEELEAARSDSGEELSSARERAAATRSEIDALTLRVKAARAAIESARNDARTARAERDSAVVKIEVLEDDKAELRQERDAAVADAEAARLRTMAVEEELARTQSRFDLQKERLEASESARALAEREAQGVSARLGWTESELVAAQNGLDATTTQLEVARAELNRAQGELADTRAALEGALGELEVVHGELEAMELLSADAEARAAIAEAESQHLRELVGGPRPAPTTSDETNPDGWTLVARDPGPGASVDALLAAPDGSWLGDELAGWDDDPASPEPVAWLDLDAPAAGASHDGVEVTALGADLAGEVRVFPRWPPDALEPEPGPDPELLVAELPKRISQIQGALDATDAKAAEPHARQIRRWLEDGGVRRLGELASHLELAISWRDLDSARQLLESLERELGDGSPLLRQLH